MVGGCFGEGAKEGERRGGAEGGEEGHCCCLFIEVGGLEIVVRVVLGWDLSVVGVWLLKASRTRCWMRMHFDVVERSRDRLRYSRNRLVAIMMLANQLPAFGVSLAMCHIHSMNE